MTPWIEKQRYLIDYTLSSLTRRKGKNVTLVLTFTVVIFFLGSVMIFTQALKKEAAILLQGSPEILVQRLAAGRHELIPLAYAEKIRQIRGVATVQTRFWGYYYDPAVRANYTLMVPAQNPPEPGRILIGQGVSRSRHLYPGEQLSLRSYSGDPVLLQVLGLLPTNSELVSSDLVLLSDEDFRNLFNYPSGSATDLALRVRNPREINTIAFKISELLPDVRPVIRDEILRTYESIFDWRSGMVVVILMASVLAFVILAWEKASGLSAEEKREIGILKAIGWETSDVLLMKFWEGTVIALSSFLAGFILAYLHVFFASATLFEHALKGWAILYPKFKLTPWIDPYQVVTLFFLTVIPYVTATIIPSWRAATIDPDTVMRT